MSCTLYMHVYMCKLLADPLLPYQGKLPSNWVASQAQLWVKQIFTKDGPKAARSGHGLARRGGLLETMDHLILVLYCRCTVWM